MLKQDNKGRTALHNAVWGIEEVEMENEEATLSSRIALNALNCCWMLVILLIYKIMTDLLLFSAVSSNAVRSVRLLYNLKANIHHKTKNKESAVFIAAKYGHLDVLKILV